MDNTVGSVREWTETATPGALMQDALDILYNVEASAQDVDRARILVTAAREMRIAKGKRNTAYENVELAFTEVTEPAKPVTTHSHVLGGGEGSSSGGEGASDDSELGLGASPV